MEATNDEPYSQFPEDNLQYKLQKAYFDKPLLSEIQRRNITNDKLKAKLVETLFAKLGSYPDFQKIEREDTATTLFKLAGIDDADLQSEMSKSVKEARRENAEKLKKKLIEMKLLKAK